MPRRALVFVALGAIGVIGCGLTHRPPARQRACKEPPVEGIAYHPDPAPDLFSGMDLDLPEAPREARTPRAFMRTGDRTSAPAIARARHGLDRRDCGAATRALAALPEAHPDRDYVAYLGAWCQWLGGDRASARATFVRLAAGSADEQLRPFLPEELLEVLVHSGDVNTALDALAQARGAISTDRFAQALFAAGKGREGGLVLRSATEPTPGATEVACRWKLAECRRAIAQRSAWGIVWTTCNDALAKRPDSTCGVDEPLAELAALYAWSGDYMGPPMRDTFREAVQRWLAPVAQHPRFDFAGRDRLALAMLVFDWSTVAKTATAWEEIFVLATRIYDRTTDPGIARAAQGVSATAHRNAEALGKYERCVEDNEAARRAR